ncbi:MAG: endonuclease III domain-containing protein [Thermodesulfobacteriales bacterium]|jgi:endonuclease-3 related protein|nr:MAG: endonuclease III domain-containing protein [Thermodesulfobacteriales bacterium]
MSTPDRIKNIYRLLYKEYGPQGWWPGDSQLESILGAILTQNTSWNNVEKAINNLKELDLISVEKLTMLTTRELAQLIKSSGYFNQKAIKIKNFITFLYDNYEGGLEKMFEEEISELRNKLLQIKGIGPETADCIILYGGNKPIFVIDTYTYRVLSRHGLVPEQTSYNEMQELVMDSLADDTQMFNEYHALLVRVGKEHCRKQNPICAGCPLEEDPHTV